MSGKKAAETEGFKSKGRGKFTHIDRANGTLLRKADLNEEKPHISPVSNLATVEQLTDEEMEIYNK